MQAEVKYTMKKGSEAKYTFEIPLSKEQTELVEKYVQFSIGVPKGHKFFATIGLLNNRIVFAIMPPKAAKKLETVLNQISRTTETIRLHP